MNKFFDKLPFKRIAEAKIPAETITKYPLLGKVILYTNQIVCVILVLLLVAILSSGSSSSKSQTSERLTSESQASNSATLESTISKSPPSKFGNYPANYEIAYFNTLGYSKVPTVKDLFEDSAPFLTEFQGVPAVVTIESIDGTGSELEALLLLSIKNQDTGEERKFVRMEVKFQSEKMTEKSYVRYVRIANLLTGKISEQKSYGSQMEDGEVLGFFAGLMVLFWDTSKLQD